MTSFNEFIGQSSGKPENNAEGIFECFECGEAVEGAVYSHKEKSLTWWCSKGHMSSLEEFNLG